MDLPRQLLSRRPYRALSCLASAGRRGHQLTSRPLDDIRQPLSGLRNVNTVSDDKAKVLRQHGTRQDHSSLLDGTLDVTKGVTTVQTHPTSTKHKSAQRPSTDSSRRDNAAQKTSRSTGDSMQDLFLAFEKGLRGGSRSSHASFTVGDMLDPNNNLGRRAPVDVPQPLPMKLGASLGRMQDLRLDKGIDLYRALKRLNSACRQNNLRSDFVKQKFHERPGLKRKRLHIQKWRTHFKEGFRGTVATVIRMRSQGW